MSQTANFQMRSTRTKTPCLQVLLQSVCLISKRIRPGLVPVGWSGDVDLLAKFERRLRNPTYRIFGITYCFAFRTCMHTPTRRDFGQLARWATATKCVSVFGCMLMARSWADLAIGMQSFKPNVGQNAQLLPGFTRTPGAGRSSTTSRRNRNSFAGRPPVLVLT